MNSKTMFYIFKRIILAILTVWVVITVTFFVTRLVPGGPFASEKAISAAAQAALEAKYGLDKPLLQQYFTYLSDIIFHFDFGPSLKQRGREVIDIITDGMKVSAVLGLVAAFSALVVGIVLGSVADLDDVGRSIRKSLDLVYVHVRRSETCFSHGELHLSKSGPEVMVFQSK